MKLGELIDVLECFPPDTVIYDKFVNPHSYRNDDGLGLERNEFWNSPSGMKSTVGELLNMIKECVDKDIHMYKGGFERMTLESDVYIAREDGKWAKKLGYDYLDLILCDWRSEDPTGLNYVFNKFKSEK